MTRLGVMATTLVLSAAAAGAGGLGISWWSIDGGGGRASGGDFGLTGTIGQADAGTMSGGPFTLSGGFWNTGDDGLPCPGDLDGSGDVDFSDLLAVLAAWGACEACPEDLDGNGIVEFADLLIVLAAINICNATLPSSRRGMSTVP